MKILFTGASSFTGFWFVQTLARAGHEIFCPLTGPPDRYEGLRKERLERLKPLCRLIPQAPFGSENFLKLAAEKFDLLCHHAAEVVNYKSPDFDPLRALERNTLHLRAVLDALHCPVVLTGSVFENDEGAGEEPRRAFSPYGLSKGLTFQVFRFYCGQAQLPLGKFVIANPFGPWEEPRFTAYLMQRWKSGQPAEVRTPDYIRDNIPVDLLAAAYAQFARTVAGATEPLLKCAPSGYIGTQGEFARRMANEVRTRTGWACELKLGPQTDFSEPLRRVNTEPATRMISDWNETASWDAFVAFYTTPSENHNAVG
jgi:UDP-glucose 4-epimerase